jgi:hypothetical protein
MRLPTQRVKSTPLESLIPARYAVHYIPPRRWVWSRSFVYPWSSGEIAPFPRVEGVLRSQSAEWSMLCSIHQVYDEFPMFSRTSAGLTIKAGTMGAPLPSSISPLQPSTPPSIPILLNKLKTSISPHPSSPPVVGSSKYRTRSNPSLLFRLGGSHSVNIVSNTLIPVAESAIVG